MKKTFSNLSLLALLLIVVAIFSCKKEDPPEVISGFTYKVDASDFRKVAFTNVSQNYKTSQWDFGDGTTSTDDNPTHIYSKTGPFTVKLTVTGDNGTDQSSQIITIVDPDAELGKLAGLSSKSWKLLRVVNANRWPLEVGPLDKVSLKPKEVWWAQGRDNDEIALRPCIMNDEWIFSRDGKMQYKTNGDYWAEGGVFDPANECRSSEAINMTGPGGIDQSAFGDGNHTFVLSTGTNPTLEVKGLGAFIGLPKIGTDTEVNKPQTSVKLDIEKLHDGDVDTLILISKWKFGNNTDGIDDAYWRIVLVHYDNPSAEPAIPNPAPAPSFTVGVDKLKITITNTTKYSDSFVWNFGDGNSSTEKNPTHTYAAPGEYKIKLTATNAVKSVTAEQTITVTDGVVKIEDIIGSAWKIRKAEKSIFVGPGLGNDGWWSTPLSFLDGSTSGPDDWSCILNDEFIFSTGGKYEYKTNGDARNDSYFGSPNGCWSDAQVLASATGKFFASAVHSFQFVPASGTSRPRIILTNGAADRAAFVGFYKGYYGGENADATKPANGGNTTNEYEVISYLKSGGVETLVLSVDISKDKDGSAAWSVVLVR